MKKILVGFLMGIIVSIGVSVYADTSAIRLLVDGTDLTDSMDVKPQMMDNRVMVPIRFISENFDAEVEWDSTSRSVVITTNPSSSGSGTGTTGGSAGTTGTGTITATDNTPALISADINRTSMDTEEKATIKVMATTTTTRVKVVSSNGKTLAETSSFTPESYCNTFEVDVNIETEGNYTLSVYAGDVSGYATRTLTVPITVNEVYVEELYIDKISLDETSVDEGDTVYVTVKTSVGVSKVVIEDKKGHEIRTKTSPTSSSSTSQTWELSFKADDSTGKNTYYVYVYNKDGDYEYEDFTFTIYSK